MTRTPDTTEYRNATNDHGAVRHSDGLVVFGFWTLRGTFMVSFAKPSKRYGTQAGAERAIRAWMGL